MGRQDPAAPRDRPRGDAVRGHTKSDALTSDRGAHSSPDNRAGTPGAGDRDPHPYPQPAPRGNTVIPADDHRLPGAAVPPAGNRPSPAPGASLRALSLIHI